MNCHDMTELLHAHLDQELDPVRSLEAEQHLKECPACLGRYQELQALRKVIAGRSSYFEAPPALARRVRTAIRQASQPQAPPARPPRGANPPLLEWRRVVDGKSGE